MPLPEGLSTTAALSAIRSRTSEWKEPLAITLVPVSPRLYRTLTFLSPIFFMVSVVVVYISLV
ncbi:hypothetical protein D3C81_2172130 [compost metagenome]